VATEEARRSYETPRASRVIQKEAFEVVARLPGRREDPEDVIAICFNRRDAKMLELAYATATFDVRYRRRIVDVSIWMQSLCEEFEPPVLPAALSVDEWEKLEEVLAESSDRGERHGDSWKSPELYEAIKKLKDWMPALLGALLVDVAARYAPEDANR
jgi:hypothetical protein